MFFSSNVNHVRRQELSDELGVSLTSNLGRYHGVLLIDDRCKVADFQFIIDKMMKHLNGWKASLLSLTG